MLQRRYRRVASINRDSTASKPKENPQDNEDARVFGEKANYWELYNDGMDVFDEDMICRAESWLDDVLVFVSDQEFKMWLPGLTVSII